jgi:hypothetical protein
MSVVPISGQAYTPELCLSEALAAAPDMESVVVLVKWRDGSTESWASWISIETMCRLSKHLDRRIHNTMSAMAERDGGE